MHQETPPILEGHVGWILGSDGRTPVRVGIDEAVTWMNANGSVRVALDGGAWGEVSTVFLPRFEREDVEPCLFETRGKSPGGRTRMGVSATYEEALAAHAAEIASLSAGPGARRGH